VGVLNLENCGDEYEMKDQKIELPEHDCLYEATNDSGFIDQEPAYRKSTVLRLIETDRQQRHLKEEAQLEREWAQLRAMQAQIEAARQRRGEPVLSPKDVEVLLAGMRRFSTQEERNAARKLIAELSAPQPTEPVKVPSGVLSFHDGSLLLRADGSGYIAVHEDQFTLHDDRCEGPDGPQGSVCWIAEFPASEIAALRDFLSGQPNSGHSEQPAAQTEPCTNTYVQTVPDQCDRIVWRGRYYHLHDGADPVAQEPMAWKWRRRPIDKWECVGWWGSIEAAAAADMESKGWEVVRLYERSAVSVEPVAQEPGWADRPIRGS
jgi:hypothetical protein